MVKKLGKVASLAVLFTSFLLLVTNVNVLAANELNNLDIEVTLQADGKAHIVETWDMSTDEGTEIYKPMELETEQELTNFEVSMNGQPMVEDTDWNIDDSFEEKAGSYGQNAGELNWGVTEYGENTYTASYDISNFVTQTETEQMIYWQFVNDSMEPAPDNMTVTINSDVEDFNYDEHRIWAFGFAGNIDITNGEIVASSSEPLSGSNYATILARIPAGTYPTSFTVDRTFDNFVEQAFEGSSYNWEDYDPNATYEDLQENDISSSNPVNRFFDRYLGVIIGGFVAIGAALIGWGTYAGVKKSRILSKYYPNMKKLEERLEGEYYREPPTKTFTQSYRVLDELDEKDLEANYLTAGLLSLVQGENLSIHQGTEDRFLRSNKEVTYFRLTENTDVPRPLNFLYQIFQSIQTDDGNISQDDFAKYVKANHSKYERYFSDTKNFSEDYLRENGHIATLEAKSKQEKTDLDRANEWNELAYTDSGFELRDSHVKFKNYLLDFSLLNERDAVEVKLWDQLMIYAATFGITDQVEEEFSKVYPQYAQEVSAYNGVPIHSFYMYSIFVNSQYQQSVSASAASSSGGGGFSSMGGGGGSFGGGSGGGVR